MDLFQDQHDYSSDDFSWPCELGKQEKEKKKKEKSFKKKLKKEKAKQSPQDSINLSWGFM
eukprot:6476839-Amphidinium_carterae.1